MFQLDTIAPTTKKRKRVGRGRYRGGTSGKGHKGQKARSGGKVKSGFEGGQMPLYRRIPKRGFNNTRFSKNCYVVDIKNIDIAFEAHAIVDREALTQKGLIRPKKGKDKSLAFVKILGNQISKPLVIKVQAYSASARQSIEAVGGKAEILETT